MRYKKINNRLYINKELNYLKSDTDNNWNTWKKLLLEDKIGNPIKYFLYPQLTDILYPFFC